jgi:hypothetical protein
MPSEDFTDKPTRRRRSPASVARTVKRKWRLENAEGKAKRAAAKAAKRQPFSAGGTTCSYRLLRRDPAPPIASN